jgi:hypothetical protein
MGSGAGLVGFWDAGSGGGGVLGLGGFWSGGHGRVPVEEAAATVAGEQLAFAKLVPHLGADAHAAAGTLLIFREGEAGATGAGDAVKADEVFGLDERTEGVALSVESGELGGELLVAEGGAGAGFFKGGGEGFDLGTSGGERGFLRLSALQAGELFIFEAIGFRGFEGDFVLDGVGLLGGFYRVELGAETSYLLAVGGDLAIETGAERLLVADGG